MDEYLLFKSKKHPDQAITIGIRDDGTYFIPAAVGVVVQEDNVFSCVEEIEQVLNDKLQLIIPNNAIN